ncbi:MAG: DUF4250 domain-containing protein [Lachnospiraceae bacterium]|nr:DUF4250 domain-containing protein [Lachnospiraceae bacterium]
MIPEDPFILVSYVNTQLRDFYPDKETMYDRLDLDGAEIEAKLKAAGFTYDREQNKFT